MSTLSIQNLAVVVGGKQILKGVNLDLLGPSTCCHGSQRRWEKHTVQRHHGESLGIRSRRVQLN